MVSRNLRSGDDDFGIDKLLVESGVIGILVGGGDQGMALLLEPLPQAKLILSGAQEARLLFGMLAALWCNPINTDAGRTMHEAILTSYRTRRTLPCRFGEAVSESIPEAGDSLSTLASAGFKIRYAWPLWLLDGKRMVLYVPFWRKMIIKRSNGLSYCLVISNRYNRR